MRASNLQIGLLPVVLALCITGCHHRTQPPVLPAPQAERITPYLGADSLALIKVVQPGPPLLERGKPQSLTVRLQYTLVSRDEAILHLTLDQFANRESCAPTSERLRSATVASVAEANVSILRGTHVVEIPMIWPGDTGGGAGEPTFGTGALSLSGSMRTTFGYEFLRYGFGTEYCMRF